MIFDKIIAFFNKQKTTKPFIDVELAADDEAIYRRYGLTPWFEDSLLQAKNLKLYRQMMTDAEIYSCINTLKIIRLSTGWEIQPASDNSRDIELRDFVDYNLSNLEGSFDDDLREIMSAIEYGISINELVWRVEDKGRYKGKIVLGNIKQKNPDKFNVQTDDFGNIKPDGLINISPYDYGKKYPIEKFLIYSFNKEFENVWGKSTLRSLYELWMLKQTLIKAWGVYLEKYGMPITKAKVPFNYFQNYEMINQIKKVLNQFRMETNIIVPDNVEIEIMKNDNTGGSPFDKAIEAINEQIRRTILGQTLTGNAGSSSYALGKVHFDILLFYVEQLGKDVAEKVINNQLIKRLIDYNFSDVDYYPKFVFKPLVQDDIVQIIEKYYAGVQNGIIKPIPEDENKIRSWLKLPEREISTDNEAQDDVGVNLIGFTEKNKIFTGVRRRTFTKYEEKVNFIDMRDIIENQTSILTIDLAKIIEESLQDLYKQIEKKKIIDEKNMKAIDDLNLKYLGDIKSKFYDMLVRVYEQSHRVGKQILSQKKKELKFQSIDFRKMTPKEVMDFFKQKSYFMTQVERDNIFKIIKPILFNVIKSGGTIKDFIKQANDKFEQYIRQGEIDEDERYSSSRLETIVRTNVNEAFNYGLRMYYEDPDLDGFVEAYQYSAIMDDRVRPNHAILDGRVFSVSNPVIDKITPPNGYNCFDELTEVYTNQGWKFFKELKGNEDFLTINPKTKMIEWQKAIRWYEDKYEGEMYHFNAWNFDLKCTPNHSLLVQKSWDRHQGKNNLKLIYANQIADSDLFYRTSKWVGKDKEKYLGLMNAKTFARFMGYWLSEGSISQSNHWVIKIAQYQQDKKYEIVEKLSEIKELLWIGKDAIYIKPLPILVEYLKQFGKSFEKYVPVEIKEMSKDNIREFLDAYLLGDGYIIPKHKFENGYESNEIKSYMTSSKKMADDLGELILKIGHYPSFTLEKRKGKEVEFRNGIFKLNTDIYYVRELESEYFTFHKKHLNKEQYKGFIYCVEVPKYNTLWIRRNGKTVWAGNCRCVLIPVVKGEQWEESKLPANWSPDLGFEK